VLFVNVLKCVSVGVNVLSFKHLHLPVSAAECPVGRWLASAAAGRSRAGRRGGGIARVRPLNAADSLQCTYIGCR